MATERCRSEVAWLLGQHGISWNRYVPWATCLILCLHGLPGGLGSTVLSPNIVRLVRNFHEREINIIVAALAGTAIKMASPSSMRCLKIAVVRNQSQVFQVWKLCNTQSCFCKRKVTMNMHNQHQPLCQTISFHVKKVGRHNMLPPPLPPHYHHYTIITTTTTLTTTTNTTITTCSSSCWQLILARLSTNPLTLLRKTNGLRFNSIIPPTITVTSFDLALYCQTGVLW